MIIIVDRIKKATHNDDSTKRSLRENQFFFSHVKLRRIPIILSNF